MASSESGKQVQSCPSCGEPVATAGLDPFAKVECPACGVPLRVERIFETYLVVEPLGTGGMGSVYKARDTRLNRFVALKLLRKEFAGDATFTAKLQEEARITASIKHPHVVEVFSVGEDHGQFYVVMELVDGGSLDDRIEDEKRISELQTLELGLQVAKGLQAALQAGLIHRDIKPGNILFEERTRAKIVDFGLALFAAQHAAETDDEIWGTPYYVAPERLTGEKEDFRSDLFSLGATLFHAISGRPTFVDETQSAAELKKLKSNPVPLREVAPDVSAETAAVIDQMLRPSPGDRQSSYQELIAQLDVAQAAFTAREKELRGRWSLPVRVLVSLGVLVVVGLLVIGVVLGLRHLPRRAAAPALASEELTATPGPGDLQAQLGAARRELQAGHYGTAEALFRELTANTPNVAPAADLSAGLQLWERGEFAQAATILERFAALQPAPAVAWLEDLKPLAQKRLTDYRLYMEWQKIRETSKDPEVALQKIRKLSARLKTKGGLAFQLADEEAKLAAQLAIQSEKRAAEEKIRTTEETPRFQAALAQERKALAAYQFDEAVAALEKLQLTAETVKAERDAELRRARWLADWKTKLINDINQTGFGGAVTDINGVRYDGPVRRARADKLELKTRYGTVMTGWLNLPPRVLLTMSTAFIRPAVADIGERQWLSAIFAAHTGQTEAAHELAAKAAAAKTEFRELLPRYFPGAKK
ncbi:MAG: protein kinase [Chthoniobacterales bacterium]